MPCSDYSSLADILSNFNGTAPLDSVICPYSSGMGAGMGLPVFSLFVFGLLGLALTARTQHPGPIIVTGVLSAAVIASTLPGIAAKVFAIVLFFGIAGAGLIIYQRAQSSL